MSSSALAKPIPALYTVYILRSTVRHASLYIGSTPNPPRRLKQHNGEIIGGAARTSRPSLRPWEMVAIVSGFPGMVAALKFEWALTNPHMSLHIPSEERISVFTQRKRNGHPKRPRASITSILSNLHLLLRVPSFARWPLSLHFFDSGVYEEWKKWATSVDEPLRRSLPVKTDFGPNDDTGTATTKKKTVPKAAASQSSQADERPWGIHALPLDYDHIKDYAAKAHSIFSFEQEGNCVHCDEDMPQGEGLYAVCPNDTCEAVGHLQCWGGHILSGENAEEGAVVPLQGRCPSCKGDLRWADMMKELSLRARDPQALDKLLAKRKRRKAKT